MSSLPLKKNLTPTKYPPPNKKNTDDNFYEVQATMCTKHCTKLTLSALKYFPLVLPCPKLPSCHLGYLY